MKKKTRFVFMPKLIVTLILIMAGIMISYEMRVFKDNKDNISDCDIVLIKTKNINDKDFESIKKTLKKVSETREKKYKVIDVNDYKKSVTRTLNVALESKASLIIVPDNSFDCEIHDIQNSYINVYFMILNGFPHDKENKDFTIDTNVCPLNYNYSEAGFLAGYYSILSGYKKISYVVSENDFASMHYYYGFIQGANYYALQNNIKNVTIDAYYTKDGNLKFDLFSDNELIIADSESTYTELNKKYKNTDFIICDDVNNISEEKNIIANTTINYNTPLYNYINDEILGIIKGGEITTIGIKENSVNLKTYDNKNSEDPTEEINKIIEEIKSNDIIVISDTSIPCDELDLNTIIVNEINL